MPDGIVIPPIVSQTVTAALTHRHERGGLPGVTRTAALTAVELAQAPITSPEVVRRVADWHARHPDHTTPDGRSTPLGGIWGGRAGRDWALEMTGKMAAARTAAPPEANTGVMVALYPDEQTATAMAIPGGETPDQIHITLGYIGQADELDPTALEAAKIALASVAERFPPLDGVIAGLGRFNGAANPGGDGESDALVALVDCPDLPELRAAVAGALADLGLPPRREHGYTPHATLAYLDPNETRPVENIDPIPLHFHSIAWVVRDDRTDLPLTGSAPVHARSAAIEEPLDIIRTIPPPKRRARLKRLSSKVNTINRDLRSKLAAGAEVAMADGLHRAGVKVVQRASKRARTVQASVAACEHGVYPAAVMAAAGITEQDALAHAFDSYGTKADRWITAANKAKRRAFIDELDYEPDDPALVAASSRWDAAKDVAVGFLLSSLTALAIDRLTNGPLEPDTRGEQVDGDVPLSIVGQAMAMADGRPVSGPGSEGPGPLGEGETTVDQFGGGIVLDLVVASEPEAQTIYTWVWSGADHPFPPHEDLDGTSTTIDDMATDWSKPEGEFPDNGEPYYSPQDHKNCGCDYDMEFGLADASLSGGDGSE